MLRIIDHGRLFLDEGDYYVAVQSVDASFIGSEFSDSFKFTVASHSNWEIQMEMIRLIF